MSCQSGLYRKAPGVRVRMVGEWGRAMVYVPARAQLFMLNVSQTIILELCEGRRMEEVVREYVEMLGGRLSEDEGKYQVARGLEQLREAGIVEVNATP